MSLPMPAATRYISGVNPVTQAAVLPGNIAKHLMDPESFCLMTAETFAMPIERSGMFCCRSFCSMISDKRSAKAPWP